MQIKQTMYEDGEISTSAQEGNAFMSVARPHKVIVEEVILQLKPDEQSKANDKLIKHAKIAREKLKEMKNKAEGKTK